MKRIPVALSPRLDVRDLRLVLALGAAGSTAEAAKVLHLTQPAVSRALLAAEGKLGTRLFERTRRGLLPTRAGERLLAGAPRMLAALVDLEQQSALAQPAPQRLRVVCECYTAYHWLPSALAGLRETLPSLEVALALEHTAAPVAALEAGEIDAALLTTALVPRRLEERPLFADEVVFLLAPTHPLAGRKVLSPVDLQRYPLLVSSPPPAEARWFMQRVFGRARPQLKLQAVPLTEAIVDLARAGLGIAVLSEWMAGPHLAKGELVAKRLASGPLQRPWRLAWRPELEDAALRLWTGLQALAPRRRLSAL